MDDGSVTQRLVVELAEVRKRMAARAVMGKRAPNPPPRSSNTSGAFDAIKEPIKIPKDGEEEEK